jgi:hypothetical protein
MRFTEGLPKTVYILDLFAAGVYVWILPFEYSQFLNILFISCPILFVKVYSFCLKLLVLLASFSKTKFFVVLPYYFDRPKFFCWNASKEEMSLKMLEKNHMSIFWELCYYSYLWPRAVDVKCKMCCSWDLSPGLYGHNLEF